MHLELSYSGFSFEEITAPTSQALITPVHQRIFSGATSGTSFATWPSDCPQSQIDEIVRLATAIRSSSDTLLVVGIGGSYLGTKAGLDFMRPQGGTDVIFVGTSFDFAALSQTLATLKNKDVTVNVVSKSGTTVEILAALNIIEKFMQKKYPQTYRSRMIYTTNTSTTYLRTLGTQHGITTLSIPDDIGGRYSVLTAVGLLPFACAGLDISQILAGARAAQTAFGSEVVAHNPAYQYAIYRHLALTQLDKKVEMFSSFNTCLASFGAWLQQLFAESQGKNQTGMFAASQTFSTDLHSVGQFLQDGSPIFAETFLLVENPSQDATLSNLDPTSPIKFLEGQTFSHLNTCAYQGTLEAHHDAHIPIVTISIPAQTEFHFGYIVYFFELACAASGMLLGINPFTQPGVEQYKSHMKKLLIKK